MKITESQMAARLQRTMEQRDKAYLALTQFQQDSLSRPGPSLASQIELLADETDIRIIDTQSVLIDEGKEDNEGKNGIIIEAVEWSRQQQLWERDKLELQRDYEVLLEV